MTVAETIRAAIGRLRDRHAAEHAQWSELYVLLGQALQAVERSDTAAASAALEDASEIEYALLGDCDITDAVVEALD